jgi:hypothetical protein
MKIRIKQRAPLFRWVPSGTGDGRWVICGGPRIRGRSMPSGNDYLAVMFGDTAWLTQAGLSWWDPLRRDWRFDWPTWLWPSDPRPYSRYAAQLGRKAGVTLRLSKRPVIVVRRS